VKQRATAAQRATLGIWRDALRDSKLDTIAKAVGFVISTYFDRDGRGAFPSKKTIAKGASVSKRTVDASIMRLALAGFLHVVRSKGRRSNIYNATLPTVQQAAPFLTVQPIAPFASNGADDDTQRCSSRHPTVQPAAPERDEIDESAFVAQPQGESTDPKAVRRMLEESGFVKPMDDA
jgi:Helix-turn-helix domain